MARSSSSSVLKVCVLALGAAACLSAAGWSFVAPPRAAPQAQAPQAQAVTAVLAGLATAQPALAYEGSINTDESNGGSFIVLLGVAIISFLFAVFTQVGPYWKAKKGDYYTLK